VKAENFIIATGMKPQVFNKGVLDVDEKFVLTSTGALNL
jgi:pyruvate/2-oxoglutarate dehydrogenase complex dihydrolipoamide dehydrogenase (E3) component